MSLDKAIAAGKEHCKTVDRARTCPKCGGHGKVDIQSGPYERTCESCGGTGKRGVKP